MAFGADPLFGTIASRKGSPEFRVDGRPDS